MQHVSTLLNNLTLKGTYVIYPWSYRPRRMNPWHKCLHSRRLVWFSMWWCPVELPPLIVVVSGLHPISRFGHFITLVSTLPVDGTRIEWVHYFSLTNSCPIHLVVMVFSARVFYLHSFLVATTFVTLSLGTLALALDRHGDSLLNLHGNLLCRCSIFLLPRHSNYIFFLSGESVIDSDSVSALISWCSCL